MMILIFQISAQDAVKEIQLFHLRQEHGSRIASSWMEAAASYLKKMHDIGLGLTKDGRYLVSDLFR